jgi:hypothetical protein
VTRLPLLEASVRRLMGRPSTPAWGIAVGGLQHRSGETPDGLRPRWHIGLSLTPFVQPLQDFIGEQHLSGRIVNPSRRALPPLLVE